MKTRTTAGRHPFAAAICATSILPLAVAISANAQDSFTPLPAISGSSPIAGGISGTNVAGSVSIAGGEGIIYNIESQAYTTFTVPGASQTIACGISGNKVVGYCQFFNSASDSYQEYGFLYIDNANTYTIFRIGSIANQAFGVSGDNIVGVYSDSNNGTGYLGFVYNTASNTYTTISVSGAYNTFVYGISGANIVGSYETCDYPYPEGFLVLRRL